MLRRENYEGNYPTYEVKGRRDFEIRGRRKGAQGTDISPSLNIWN